MIKEQGRLIWLILLVIIINLSLLFGFGNHGNLGSESQTSEEDELQNLSEILNLTGSSPELMNQPNARPSENMVYMKNATKGVELGRLHQTTQCGLETNAYFDPNEKLLFCIIPKNACTKEKMTLMKIRGHPNWQDFDVAHNPERNQLESFCQRPLNQVNDILTDPSYLRIVIIRDPVERFISAYNDKVKGTRDVRYFESKFVPNTTLDSFIDSLARRIQVPNRRNMVDKHVRPQSEFCDLKQTSHLYHLICANNIREELYELLSKQNDNIWNQYQLDQVFGSYTNHTTHTKDKLAQIDAATKAKIRKIYSADYDSLLKLEFFNHASARRCLDLPN